MTDLLNDIYADGCKAKKYRLSDFFNRWWDEYAQHPAEYITPEQYKAVNAIRVRSEERRVGKECRSRWSPYH